MEQKMDCVCGYRLEKEWGEVATKGDELFIPISNEVGFTIPNPKKRNHGDYDYNLNVKVDLYACPKCGTVKMVFDE